MHVCKPGWLALGALLALPSSAAAAPPIRNGGNIGLGLGATTDIVGLDLKYWTNRRISVQGVFGVHDLQGGLSPVTLGVDGDLLYEIPFASSDGEVDFGMYFGVGGIWAIDVEDPGLDYLGANLVVGPELNIDAVPIDIGIDYRPALFFVDELNGLDGGQANVGDFRLDLVEFGVHVRYWF
jgi:hypothetical protein